MPVLEGPAFHDFPFSKSGGPEVSEYFGVLDGGDFASVDEFLIAFGRNELIYFGYLSTYATVPTSVSHGFPVLRDSTITWIQAKADNATANDFQLEVDGSVIETFPGTLFWNEPPRTRDYDVDAGSVIAIEVLSPGQGGTSPRYPIVVLGVRHRNS